MRNAVAAIALALAPLFPAAAQQAEVAVTGGRVRGAAEDARLVFRGIPFAAPPLAGRRWMAPGPVVAWPGVRDAAAPAPACLQNDYGWNRADHVFASEDCLTLDVGTASLDGRRPVFVWIHGGSNRAGSPAGFVRSGLVDRGIVVVGVRYRLGIFGFLPHRRLADADGGAGNYGLMDQIAALRWVRDNIARFGGDPDNVTIGGDSAGAQDVSLLLASPLTRGLFARAMMESGTPGFGLPPRPREEAFRIGDQLDALLGRELDRAGLGEVAANALLAADLKLHDPVLTADDYLYLRTTIDGVVLPAEPATLLRRAPRRAVVIGSNAFELDLPGGRAARDAFVRLSFGEDREAAARRLYGLDGPDAAPDPRLGSIDQIIATDATFRCPARRLATLLAAEGWPVYRYSFDAAPGGGRTQHSAELGYFHGDRRIGGLSLQNYGVAFARAGDPNAEGMPAWPRLRAMADDLLFIDNDGVRAAAEDRTDICDLTEHL